MSFSRKHLIYAAAAPLTLGALLATTAGHPASAHGPPAPRRGSRLDGAGRRAALSSTSSSSRCRASAATTARSSTPTGTTRSRVPASTPRRPERTTWSSCSEASTSTP